MRGYAKAGFAMRFALAFALVLLAAGCVYKIDVQQGNYVTQDLVEKLKKGMTKAEVKNLLGTPLLADTFHANRWDYYFSNVRGRKAEKTSRLTIFFEDERLVSYIGEARPEGSPSAATPISEPRAPPPRSAPPAK